MNNCFFIYKVGQLFGSSSFLPVWSLTTGDAIGGAGAGDNGVGRVTRRRCRRKGVTWWWSVLLGGGDGRGDDDVDAIVNLFEILPNLIESGLHFELLIRVLHFDAFGLAVEL